MDFFSKALSSILDIIIKLIDGIFELFNKLINIISCIIDTISISFDRLSTQIFNLLSVSSHLGFYLTPFVGAVYVGIIKEWNILFWIGAGFCGLIAIAFVRELISSARGEKAKTDNEMPRERRRKVLWLITLMNLMLVAFFIFDYLELSDRFTTFQEGITSQKEEWREQ